MQATFQTVVITDGNTTFALFLYDDLMGKNIFQSSFLRERHERGFDVGDNRRHLRISDSISTPELYYRIDGKYCPQISYQGVLRHKPY